MKPLRKTTLRQRALPLAALALLSLPGALSAQDPGSPEAKKLGEAIRAQLGAIRGQSLYVMTDKPLYRPGETIWFRAFELERKSLSAAPGDHGVTFQLIDPRGSKVIEKRVLSQGGVAANDFVLSRGLAGGSYILRAISDRGPSHDTSINVSAYEVPRIKKTLDFARKSYAPGEIVTAFVTLEQATGEPLRGAKVRAIIQIDGVEIARLFVPTDWNGKGMIRFQLPPRIKEGDGLLTLMVDAGGINESIQRRVPIVLDTVKLSFFPEGGDLVTGLRSRVYVAARDTADAPVDAEGMVIDDRGKPVASFRGFHAGMARFAFTPEAGRSYHVKLNRPSGNKQTFDLPSAMASGCVLSAVDDFASKRAEITIEAACTDAQKVIATAVLRESLLGHTEALLAQKRPSKLTLPLSSGTVGAVRVTLFNDKDDKKTPLAERLVYRGLGADLRVSIKADRGEKDSYSPRDKVKLSIETRDAKGEPVAADLALSVVDDSLLRFADDKGARILAELYLLPEMPGQTIRDPNFYFSKDPKAPEALDLLLGTQGYRRFTWQWIGPGPHG